jgi:endoglucanase
LYIDFVFGPDCADKVPAGTAGVFKAPRQAERRYICAKALDNRLCVAVMLDAVRKLMDCVLNADLYILASVQEELGTRGAVTGAFGIRPDNCVAIDVTHCRNADAPKTGVVQAGKGPAIGVGPNMNRRFRKN